MVETSVEKIQQIKGNLDEIKKSVDDLNQEIVDLNKNKANLEQAEFDRKNKEIEEKKLEIKKKKEETQELIKQTRELADLEQDITVTNEIRKELDIYEKQLKEIQPQSNTFWEKVKEKGGKTIERVKENPWKTAGIGLAVVGIIALFRRRKKNKEEKEGDDGDKKEKKGFWKSGFGKFLKWTGIGLGAFFGIKWLMNKFGKESGTDNHDENQDKIGSYEEFVENNPEEAEKYEKFGDNVDGLYNNIFAKEIENGWEDDSDMDSISQELGGKSLKGLVPFCMDNSFSDVDSILSEWGIEVDLYQKNTQEIKTKVLSRLRSKVGGALKSFLEILPSWTTFGVGNNLEEKFSAWIDSDPQARISELKAFFRQQMRVTVFLKTKEGELINAIAKKKFETDKGDFEDHQEALDDDERFERNIKDDLDYKSFREGKIINAYSILDKYNIMSGEMNEDTTEIVQECDDKRDYILDGSDGDDIIKRCEDDIGDGSLETENEKQLSKSCDKIVDDIKDLEIVAEDRMFDMYKRLFNTENANKEELLKNSTILPLLKVIRENIPGLKQKIASGEMTAADVTSLKQFMNNYFALKKELEIGVNIYEMVKSDDGSVIIRFTKLFEDMFKNMGKGFGKLFKGEIFSGLGWLLTGVAPIAVITGLVIAFKKYPGTMLKYTLLSPVTVPGKVYQASLGTARKIGGKYRGPSGSLRRMFFGEADGPQKLVDELGKGKISLKKAQEIVDGSQIRTTQKIKDRRFNSKDGLFTKDVGWKKGKLLKKAFSDKTMIDDDWKLLAKYFDNRSFNGLVLNNFDESLRLAKLYESKIASLTNKQSKLFDLVTNTKMFSKTDLEKLIKNIDQINLDDVPEKELPKLAKKLSKKIGKLSSAAEINIEIENIRKVINKPKIDVIDDVKIKDIGRRVDLELNIMKKELDKIKPGSPNYSRHIKAYYEDSIKSLENMKLRANTFSDIEYRALIRFSDNGFDMSSMAKLHRMLEVNVPGSDLIKKAMSEGNFDELKYSLRIASQDQNFLKYVKLDDINKIVSKIDTAGKKLISNSDDIALLLKNMFKVFTKIT
ncbi:hypothetical protein K9M48_05200 [Candidatus Gracilibacteria bacterium]|nr:hypothetical protein [Candidatus Gracilibacteria bacterium]